MRPKYDLSVVCLWCQEDFNVDDTDATSYWQFCSPECENMAHTFPEEISKWEKKIIDARLQYEQENSSEQGIDTIP